MRIKILILLCLITINSFGEVREKKINKIEDLIFISEEKNVEAVIYKNSFDFSSLDIKKRKKAFISMILPSILIINKEINENRKIIKKDIKGEKLSFLEKRNLNKIKTEYKTENSNKLLKNYNIIPVEMVLAQAIVESGWGQSRFFIEANNIFGIWSYSDKDNKIKALKKRGKKDIYLKAYDSIYDSLKDYYNLINTGTAYKDFRVQREKSLELNKLILTLVNYSELGEVYIEKLNEIISYNKLEKYSKYQIE